MDQPKDQSTFWDERAEAWDRNAEAREGFARQFGGPAMDLLGPVSGEHLADIGCGPGLTTIELAHRVAPAGTVTGIDVSPRMVESASARSQAMDVGASFVVGDPSAGPVGSFDGIYSRFGVMFFDDPTTAFRNIARSIRPGGRFVAVVWATLDENPWMFVPTLFGAGPLNADLTLPGLGSPDRSRWPTPPRRRRCSSPAGSRTWRSSATNTHGPSTRRPRTLPSRRCSRSARGARHGRQPMLVLERPTVEAVLNACDDHRDQDGWRLPATALTISASVPS